LLLAGCSERKITAPSSTLDLTASVERHDRKPDCKDVRGAFVSRASHSRDDDGRRCRHSAWNLSGTFAAEYFDIAPQADGVINMHAHHTITRRGGTIMTSDEIRLFPDPDPAWVQPRSRLEVTGGTGVYKGATGLLLTDGRVNLNVVRPPGQSRLEDSCAYRRPRGTAIARTRVRVTPSPPFTSAAYDAPVLVDR